MAEVTLVYMVPVYVDVDTDEGVVLSVNIGDETVEHPNEDWLDAEEGRRAAYEVAERAVWPSWEFGF